MQCPKTRSLSGLRSPKEATLRPPEAEPKRQVSVLSLQSKVHGQFSPFKGPGVKSKSTVFSQRSAKSSLYISGWLSTHNSLHTGCTYRAQSVEIGTFSISKPAKAICSPQSSVGSQQLAKSILHMLSWLSMYKSLHTCYTYSAQSVEIETSSISKPAKAIRNPKSPVSCILLPVLLFHP